MANKLPWFTHYHNARNDDFIQRAEDQFGHFGYAAWFKIIELLHEHGKGDVLLITQSRLGRELRTKSAQVRQFLTFCRDSGKLSWDESQQEVRIEIKNFRERQGKMKSKTPSKLPQDSPKPPIHIQYRDIDIKEKNITKTPPNDTAKISEPKIRTLTPQQIVVRYFKEAKGVLADDKDWDRKHWNGRLMKDAAALLRVFDDDPVKAGRYLLIKGEEWRELPDWGIRGVIAAAGRDPRVNGQSGEKNEQQIGAVDADSIPGRTRLKQVARAGEVTGDALNALRQQAEISHEGTQHVGESCNTEFDNETFIT